MPARIPTTSSDSCSSTPTCLEPTTGIIDYLDPELLWLPEDELKELELWRDDPEQMDEIESVWELDAATDSVPAAPAILLIPEESEAPPEFGEGAPEALPQAASATRWTCSNLARSASSTRPTTCIPVIPEEIAAAVREVIGAATATEGSASPQTTTST